jgi:tetratricopeptide (TPR) repeat protein
MGRVYAALFHGCRAGRYGDALRVYRERIQRGRDRFSLHKLGESGPGLVAMKQFCMPGGYDPVGELGAADRSFVLAEAARYLRAQGRLRESADAFRASFDLSSSLGHWEEAARRAGNLSQVLMWQGQLGAAEERAAEGQRLVDHHGDAELRMSSLTDVAEVLHQRGRLDDAAPLFDEAIEIQGERQPELPLLHAVEGVRYLDLLLSLGRPHEVEAHLARLAQIRQTRGPLPGDSLLVAALEDLVRGRARLDLAAGEDADEWLRIGIQFDRAVDGLRRAGTLHHLPRGLFARADLHRRRGDYQKALEDLEEAKSVAERGGMRLHLADYWLGRARLERDLGQREPFETALSEAGRLIRGIGYLRRSGELQQLQP